MAKLTQDIKDIMAKTRGYAVATCTKDGIPNVVPIHFVKILSDDEIMMADIFMKKTFENIQQNPVMAISVWDWDVKPRRGFQFKGIPRIETSGRIYDMAVEMVKAKKPDLTPKSAIVVKITDIFVTSPRPDAGKNVEEVA
ncbi:MAG: pyridoxamine 5'-phosphate oxidase family protein [Deltaproteobacteria bacterium]|nr:pyridoxamine 5'-phosphate oxidase family protein [Deltaproteobacteria bacterium]MBW2075324.1 pyridoxamine 5'-phosphate oxidase family protein [Deltaproteobacteria bacterium]